MMWVFFFYEDFEESWHKLFKNTKSVLINDSVLYQSTVEWFVIGSQDVVSKHGQINRHKISNVHC